jgi:hypothetical protein
MAQFMEAELCFRYPEDMKAATATFIEQGLDVEHLDYKDEYYGELVTLTTWIIVKARPDTELARDEQRTRHSSLNAITAASLVSGRRRILTRAG